MRLADAERTGLQEHALTDDLALASFGELGWSSRV